MTLSTSYYGLAAAVYVLLVADAFSVFETGQAS
jgi:hypothetical protein